jgi:hypothetical protein
MYYVRASVVEWQRNLRRRATGYITLDILTVMTVHITVLWDVAPYILLPNYTGSQSKNSNP